MWERDRGITEEGKYLKRREGACPTGQVEKPLLGRGTFPPL